ncbi:pyridoxal phosphate-dependent aminotransferase [Streptomyces sp. ISL-10]|uniref:MalY/PatB family protein n=1 Tax=Streptomyces sp. ISL-10 TaxID=2819172 RepID=UPI001BE6E0AF|nr:MalY/PatB family protein [Streptomyces sp. ISL-10]MBT2370115.1 pyridoxal phosphate-dependent aminotransferase [Streptomyces sp. ISL-10]
MLNVTAVGGRGSTGAAAGERANPLEELSLEQLRRRRSMKWRTHPADVLPLWVAEMDVPLAPPVADALREAIETGDTGYPAGTEFAESLAGFASRRWKWDGVAVDRVAVIPDVMMGAVQVLRLITDFGDPVVVNSPVYAPFYAFVTHNDRRIIEAPLGQDLRVSLETLEETFRRAREHSGKGKIAYLLSNPHNPTGTVHTFEELAAVAALARQYGIRVVADEIHAPLVLPGATFTPYLSVPGAEDAFSLMSATKGWNLAGIKAALAIAGPEAAADLRRMPEEVHHGASYLGVIAHTAAYRHGDKWLDALLAGLDANRALLGRLVAEHLPGVEYTRPEGTYLAWLDCRPLGLAPEKGTTDLAVVTELAGPAQLFLEHARVALSSGHIFGTGGAGHVRLNFATSQSVLTEAITRMGRTAALHTH